MRSLFHSLFESILKPTPPSVAYRRWRRQFLLERSRVAAWMAIIAQLFLLGVSVLLAVPLLNASGDPEMHVSRADIWQECISTSISAAVFGFSLLLLKWPRIVRVPELLILLFPIAILVIPELPYPTDLQDAIEDLDIMIVFWCQAIIMPVQWRWHLLSQLLTLSCLFATNHQMPVDSSIDNLLIWLVIVLAYSVMVFALANGGIWFHERSLMREFDLREQLQTFLQSISQELKAPIRDTIELLRGLQRDSTRPISADQSTTKLSATEVEQLLQNGDSQLQLLQTLLESAHTSENEMEKPL